jgi:hypothetical protein
MVSMTENLDPARRRLPSPGAVCRVRRWSGTPADIGWQMAADLQSTPEAPDARYISRWRGWRRDPTVVARARSICLTLERLWPSLLTETEALAAALGVDPRAVLADWAAPPRPVLAEGRSCTVFWVPAACSADGKPIVGRNFDLRISQPVRLFIYTNPRVGLAHAGMGGRSGRAEGINEAGLIVGTTEAQLRADLVPDLGGSAAHGERIGGRGAIGGALPARLVTRILLESCRTVAQAIAKLEVMAHWTHFNFLLADAQGDAAVFEVGYSRTALRRPPAAQQGSPWLITTNHYLAPELAAEADYRWLTRQKYGQTLAALDAARAEGPLDVAACQSVLRRPGVAQRHLTLWSEVFVAGGEHLRLCPGRPDRNEYVVLPAPGFGAAPGPFDLPSIP